VCDFSILKLLKVKAHRGEPLNEGADDLAETGRAMEKEGDKNRWKERTTRVVYTYYEKSDCSSEQTNGVRGYLRNTVRTEMEINQMVYSLEGGDMSRSGGGERPQRASQRRERQRRGRGHDSKRILMV
jgi:hypothetical protein